MAWVDITFQTVSISWLLNTSPLSSARMTVRVVTVQTLAASLLLSHPGRARAYQI